MERIGNKVVTAQFSKRRIGMRTLDQELAKEGENGLEFLGINLFNRDYIL